jgi:hypothetical protein
MGSAAAGWGALRRAVLLQPPEWCRVRLLLVPVLNYPNEIEADSIYTITRDWAGRLADAMPDAAIYRLVPKLDDPHPFKRFRSASGHKKHHPRVHDLEVRMFARYDLEESNIDPDVYLKFHPNVGDIAVDGVICTSSIKLAGVKRMLTAYGGFNNAHSFFSFDLLIRGIGTNEVSQVTEDEMIMQAAGQAMSWNLFESPKCERMALTAARRYLAPAQLNGIQSRATMAYSGFADDECDPLPLEDREKEFTVIARGRITSSKNVDEIMALYNARFASGHDLNIVMTTGDLSGGRGLGDELKKNPRIKLMNLKSKAEANKVMRKAHAFVLWSTHELFCVSLWEMFAAGLIGAVYEADWHKGMLPPKYPFVFKNAPEAYTMLGEIQDNYEHWSRELAWVKDWVREQYAYRNTTTRTASFIRSALEKDGHRPTRDWLAKLFADSGENEFTLSGAIEWLKKNLDKGAAMVQGGNPIHAYATIGPRETYKALELAGFADTLLEPDPLFVRNQG